MKSLIIYRILSYPVITIAAFLILVVLGILPTALSNPIFLLTVFVLACVIIYSFASWRFLTRGIDNRQPCKPLLRDLIRVNSFFTIGLAVLLLLDVLFILAQPSFLNDTAEKAMGSLSSEAGFTKSKVISMLRFFVGFFLVYGILLLAHVYFTFRLLKEHRGLFDHKPEQP